MQILHNTILTQYGFRCGSHARIWISGVYEHSRWVNRVITKHAKQDIYVSIFGGKKGVRTAHYVGVPPDMLPERDALYLAFCQYLSQMVHRSTNVK